MLSLSQQHDQPKDGDKQYERNYVTTTYLQLPYQRATRGSQNPGSKDCRGKTIEPGTLLQDCDFTGAKLGDVDLHMAKLSRANLSGANLSGANLSGADLRDVDLSEADLSEADLSRANLDYAKLGHAYLYFAKLTKTNLSDADLNMALLVGANLTEAKLPGANLSNVVAHHVVLSSANLTGATLVRTTLTKATLTNAELRGVDLGGVDLGSVLLPKETPSERLIRLFSRFFQVAPTLVDRRSAGEIRISRFSWRCRNICATQQASDFRQSAPRGEPYRQESRRICRITGPASASAPHVSSGRSHDSRVERQLERWTVEMQHTLGKGRLATNAPAHSAPTRSTARPRLGRCAPARQLSCWQRRRAGLCAKFVFDPRW
ncbi:MAG: pentapeptide repeat-containing protein [Actinomycetia bacterium]|nr:pentapeptide repeat-containing protein [Actinomycetes bacterium]